MGCKKFQVVSYHFDDAPNLLDAGRRLYDLSKRVPLPLKFVGPQSSDPNKQDSNLHLLVQEQPSNGRHCLIPSSVSVVRVTRIHGQIIRNVHVPKRIFRVGLQEQLADVQCKIVVLGLLIPEPKVLS